MGCRTNCSGCIFTTGKLVKNIAIDTERGKSRQSAERAKCPSGPDYARTHKHTKRLEHLSMNVDYV